MTIKLNISSNFTFENVLDQNPFNPENPKRLESLILKITNFLSKNKVFLYLSFSHLFTLIHEFGHALAYKIMTGKGSTITMSPLHCYGITKFEKTDYPLTDIQDICLSLSGHLATVLFSAIIILGIFALTHYVAMPLGVVIALRIIVTAPIILNFLGDGIYATTSASRSNDGDFGEIRHRGGLTAVFLCAAFLIGIIALCIVGIVFLF